ncbi:MAG: hypothetical protein U1A27_04865 [Phycisphaerae bacterium]
MADSTTALDQFAAAVDRLAGGGATAAAASAPTSAADPSGSAAPKIAAAGGDAIDAVLAGAPRTTAVVSLVDSPVMQKFRQELTDGLIRVDTVNQLLQLAALVLSKLPIGK